MKKIILVFSMLFSIVYGQICADTDTAMANNVSLITSSSARVNATVTHFSGAVTGLNLRYVRTGQTDTATAAGSFSSGLRNLTGLQAGTQYTYYYQTVCGSGTNRQLGTYTFTTATNTINYVDERPTRFHYVYADTLLQIPSVDTSLYRAPTHPSIVYKASDDTYYGYNVGGGFWQPLAIDSAGIIALLNGKVDSVTVGGNIVYYWKQGVSYGNSLPERVDSLTRTEGVDSIYFWKNGTATAILDSTGGGGLSTASNGLTAVGSDVQLGGTLTQSTNITTTLTEPFLINNGIIYFDTAGNYNTYIVGGIGNVEDWFTTVGTHSGDSNSGFSFTGMGVFAGYNNTGQNFTGVGAQTGTFNTGNNFTGIGEGAGISNTGDDFTGLGLNAGELNTGNNFTGGGVNTGYGNSGNGITAFGYKAAYNNTYKNIIALGINANASANNQLVISDSVSQIKAVGFTTSAGRVLTDVAGNGILTLETPSGGSSQWTDTTAGIYYPDFVGIGSVMNPAYPLHIIKNSSQVRIGYDGSAYTDLNVLASGTLRISSINDAVQIFRSGGSATLQVFNAAGSDGVQLFGGTNTISSASGTGNIIISPGASEKVKIGSSSAPDSTLTVAGSAHITGYLKVDTDPLIYEALVTETGGVQSAIVLKNTTGVTFTLSSTDAGEIKIDADSGTPFTVNKTLVYVSMNSDGNTPPSATYSANYYHAGNTRVIINTFSDGIITANIAANMSVKIVIYP